MSESAPANAKPSRRNRRKGKGKSGQPTNPKQTQAPAKKQGGVNIKRTAAYPAPNPQYKANVPNPLLACVLDPESAPPFCYPDELCEPSAVNRLIVDADITKATNGEFFLRVDPTLKGFLTMGTDLGAATVTWAAGSQYPSASQPESAEGLGPALIGAAFTDVADTPAFQLTSAGSAGRLRQIGSTTYLPTLSGNATLTCVSLRTWAEEDLSQILWQMVPNTGAAVVAAAGVVTIPAAVTSFSIQAKTAAAAAYIKSFEFTLSTPAAASATAQTQYLKTIDNQDYASLVANDGTSQLCEAYRVVAQSVLVTYMGATNADGGKIAAVRTSGGQDPDDLGYTSYSTIAARKGALGGPLKFGAYGWWMGSDSRDYQYRDPSASNADGSLPCMVIAGKADDPNQSVKVRIVTVIEWKTQKSYIPTRPSVVDGFMRESAIRAVSNFNVWHENPNHKKDIKSFFNDVLNFGSQLYNTVNAGIQNSIKQIPGALQLIGGLGAGVGGLAGSLGPLAGLLPLLL